MKTFDIVIVNWNSGFQLKDCVESIVNSKKDNCILNNIIIVDNNSKDSSIKLVENLNFEVVKVIKNKENFGFGKACNIGAEESKSDFVLFLNPDAMVYENTFINLYDYIENNDKDNIAVYGVQLVGEDGITQRTCARFPTLLSFIIKILGLNKLSNKLFKSYTMENWDHSTTKKVNQVIGAFFLIKNKIFIELGGFDERYFVYYEELDLSKRLYDKGFISVYFSNSQAYHKGGGVSEQVKALRFYYNTKSNLIYAIKHLGLLQGIVLMLFVYLVEPFSRTIFLAFKKSPKEEFIQLYKGFLMLYSDTLNIIKLGLKE